MDSRRQTRAGIPTPGRLNLIEDDLDRTDQSFSSHGTFHAEEERKHDKEHEELRADNKAIMRTLVALLVSITLIALGVAAKLTFG